jgi:ABC-type Fe3+/spermidine/putrescine transport system ATPase subunit
MLTLSHLSKSFGSTCAVCDVSCEVAPGEIVAVLGPSGCGKSTLLGLVAGLEPPDQGNIRWDGQSLRGVPPHRRGFGLMFQDYALFPHLNVFANVAFGLQGSPQGQRQATVTDVLTLVGLAGFERRDVNTLSGGEQQRVALARSLAPQPRLLMLDEPLGALDRNLRQRLIGELRTILRQLHQTAIYVTHDLEEAFTIADQVVVMNAGRVEQIAAPQALYQRPATSFVAAFLGLTNQLPGVARQGWVATDLGRFAAPAATDGPVVVLIRPEMAQLSAGSMTLEGVVVEKVFRGPLCHLSLRAGAHTLGFDFPASTALPPVGEILRLGVEPNGVQVLPNPA